MNKFFKIGAIVFAVISICSTTACLNDGDGGQGFTPDIAAPSKVIVKAALIDALWGLTDDPNLDATCVANSTLTFGTENPLMIKKNEELTEYNESDVIIVGSIQIPMLDNTAGERAPECGTQPITYVVTASDLAPIDIVSAETSTTRQSLEAKARVNPTPYPSGCHVRAHFEKSGEIVIPDEEEENDEDYEDDESDDDEELSENDDVDNDDGDEEEISEDEETDDEEAEEDAPIYSLKLVIDAYDCSQQSTVLVPRNYPNNNNPAPTGPTPNDPHAPKPVDPNAPTAATKLN
ncbi:MAG: hypothetical protein HN337_06200 [Deltaproteobacteria bacterium]|jgi:hypothetical protein|nr:hypothetical protein [Deltaproteobacteria bacterium]